MPELPEVETIRRDLEGKVINKKIISFYVDDTRVLQGLGKAQFVKHIEGVSIKRIDRRGKILIFKLDSGYFLLMHLKMTGQLVYIVSKDIIAGGPAQIARQIVAGGHEQGEIGKLPNKHTRVIFEFEDRSKLFFNDQRRFGYVRIVDDNQRKRIVQYFGVEPLSAEFSLKYFVGIFRNRTTAIKNILLNQNIIAGIGNIYADEICFEARVRPDRRAETLREAEKKRIYKAIGKILRKAVDYRGTTFSHYRDSDGKKGNYSQQLKVYGREGEKCLRCRNGVINKIKIGQRGTCYCPHCQV